MKHIYPHGSSTQARWHCANRDLVQSARCKTTARNVTVCISMRRNTAFRSCCAAAAAAAVAAAAAAAIVFVPAGACALRCRVQRSSLPQGTIAFHTAAVQH